MYFAFHKLILVLFFTLVVRYQGSHSEDLDNYHGLSKQKFRTQRLNVVWDEALKVSPYLLYFLLIQICFPQHLKGQKLKNLMTELKAHEKALLALKKKSQTPDDEEEGGSLKSLQSKNLKWMDESVNLEQDLEKILSRHHLDVSLAHTYKQMKNFHEQHDHRDTENHINSVLETSERRGVKKYDETRVELMHTKASALALDVLKKFDDVSEEGRKRRKEFEEWFNALELDLTMLDSRLKKQRWLEDELARWQTKKKDKFESQTSHNNGDSDNSGDLDQSDVQKRLKSLTYKINKTEKEIKERIKGRKYHEFPTSHSEGEL